MSESDIERLHVARDYALDEMLVALKKISCAVIAQDGGRLPWTANDVVYHLTRLRVERDHYKRCGESRTCGIDTPEDGRTCAEQIEKALIATGVR